MGDERVDEGAIGIAGRGMDDEPGRLVDDDDVLVLEADVERHRLRRRPVVHRRRHAHRIELARFDPERGVAYRRAAEAHVALFDEALEPGARKPVQTRRQKPVEALSGLVLLDRHGVRMRFGWHGR